MRTPENTKDQPGILIVDPDSRARDSLAAVLHKINGSDILVADTPAAAMKTAGETDLSLLIMDLSQSGKKGPRFVKEIHAAFPDLTIIVAVPAEDRRLATDAMRFGAFMHISSPYDHDEAVIVAGRGLAFHETPGGRSVASSATPRHKKTEGFHGIIGKSSPMVHLFDLIRKVASDDVSTVLIHGESGTGKELVAQVIHSQSPRKSKNIVPVNCAAIPDELLESELFGYVKGAFTGANQSKMGRIQYADGGTLFLDEIGDMKPTLQAKLLRVIQEKEFEPVGGLKPIPIDIRIIAATHRDLEKMVEEGSFRADLYYRLNVIPVIIPPLRERTDDIPLLADKFIQRLNSNNRVPLQGFAGQALATLRAYSWPGNVRELENLVQHMAILHAGETVQLEDLPAKYQAAPGASQQPAPAAAAFSQQNFSWDKGKVDFNTLINEFENQLILKALMQTNGNKKEAATLLNLKRTTLIEKIKKKNIRLEIVRQPSPDSFPDEFRFFP